MEEPVCSMSKASISVEKTMKAIRDIRDIVSADAKMEKKSSPPKGKQRYQ